MRCLEYVFYTLTEEIQSHIYSPGHNQIWIYDDVTHICKMAPTPGKTRRSPPGSLLRLEVFFPPYYFEGANGGTQFSVNYYFFGQFSVNYLFWLAINFHFPTANIIPS